MIIRLAIGLLTINSLLSFYAERERIADIGFVILQIDPIWFEDGFIEVNIYLSKIPFLNETSIKMLTKCCKQNLYYIYDF